MFIAKNEDLIILAKETREELEKALQFMVYTSIEETEIEYELYSGSYLTKEEIQQQERERIMQLTMTSLDLINCLKGEGLTLAQINNFLEANLELKMQLTYCQNVYCGVVVGLCPLTIEDIEITEDKVISWFVNK